MKLSGLVALAIERRYGHQRSAEHAVAALRRYQECYGGDESVRKALSPAYLRQYLANLAKQAAPATVRRHAAVLSGLLQVAREEGVKVPAVLDVPRLGPPRARGRVLTEAEVDSMVALVGAVNYDCGRLVRFLAETGCRVGEALSLGWDGVGDRRATFRETKNGSTRTVPLSDAALKALDLPLGWYGGNMAIGVHAPKPFPVTSSQLNHAWRRGMVSLGVTDKDFVPHALRHTFGTRLAASGVSLPVIMRFLGHRDVKSAMRYQHAGVEDLELALTKLRG